MARRKRKQGPGGRFALRNRGGERGRGRGGWALGVRARSMKNGRAGRDQVMHRENSGQFLITILLVQILVVHPDRQMN